MHTERVTIAVTTDASGDVTAYSDRPVSGRVLAFRYVPDGTSPLDTGADLTITGNESGMTLFAKSNIGTSAFTAAPRQATHLNTDGSAALFAAAGQAVLDHVVVADELIKVVVAQGGDTKSGTIHLILG